GSGPCRQAHPDEGGRPDGEHGGGGGDVGRGAARLRRDHVFQQAQASRRLVRHTQRVQEAGRRTDPANGRQRPFWGRLRRRRRQRQHGAMQADLARGLSAGV
ncbi:unnamed protein product, partial [Ascophyllum nodosum]